MNPGNKNRDKLIKLITRTDFKIKTPEIENKMQERLSKHHEESDLHLFMSDKFRKKPNAIPSKKTQTINYPIADHLVKSSSELKAISGEHASTICIYEVKEIHERKVVMYLLYKMQDLDKPLVFPYFKTNTVDDLETKNATLLDKLNGNLRDKTQLTGFLQSNDVVYSFYKYTGAFDVKEPYYWGCLTELANSQSIFGYGINNIVSDLFVDNDFLTNVYKSESTYYENPIVLYSTSNDTDNILSLTVGDNHNLDKEFHLYKDISTQGEPMRNIVFLDNLQLGENKVDDFDTDKFDSFHYKNIHNKISWHIKTENNIELMKFL
jgi:hypothetical protein